MDPIEIADNQTSGNTQPVMQATLVGVLHSVFKYALAGYIAHMTVSALERKDSK